MLVVRVTYLLKIRRNHLILVLELGEWIQQPDVQRQIVMRQRLVAVKIDELND